MGLDKRQRKFRNYMASYFSHVTSRSRKRAKPITSGADGEGNNNNRNSSRRYKDRANGNLQSGERPSKDSQN